MARVSVLCSDSKHPVYPHLAKWVAGLSSEHEAELVGRAEELSGGDMLMLISCHQIIDDSVRARYDTSLIVHASDLPEGRGWSPLIWQVLEGKTEIVVSMIEARPAVDTGPIWAQRAIRLEGHELHDEINALLFATTLSLMTFAVEHAFEIRPRAQDARAPTYFRRRTPEDSRIDPEKSIATQFDLLRVADPERYPAFFDLRGCRYLVRLEKAR